MSSFIDQPAEKYYLNDGETDLATETFYGINHPDTVRVTHATDVTVGGKLIFNGNEDCIDILGGYRTKIEDCELRPSGRNGITIKGWSSWVRLDNLTFAFHGKETDIDLGNFDNHWFPGRPPTSNTIINNCKVMDGTKLIVRVIDAQPPFTSTMMEGITLIKVPKWKWYPYFLFRYIELRVINLYLKLTNQLEIDTQPYRPGTLFTQP